MKDAYYFSHDSNSRNDLKMVKLRRLSGLEGVGLFWCVVEMLRESENYELPLSDIEDICYDLRIDQSVFNHLFDCCLLVKNKNKFYSKSLKDRMLIVDEIRQKRSKAGSKGGKAKANAKQMLKQKESKDEANRSNKKKGKEIKENETKENQVVKENLTTDNEVTYEDIAKQQMEEIQKYPLDKILDMYGKSIGQNSPALKYEWNNMSVEEQNKVIDHIPEYIKAFPNVRFRKNFLNYLIEKTYLDPVQTGEPSFKEFIQACYNKEPRKTVNAITNLWREYKKMEDKANYMRWMDRLKYVDNDSKEDRESEKYNKIREESGIDEILSKKK